MTTFPGYWNPQQATMIVDSAIRLMCNEIELRGANVSASVYPME